MAKKDIEQTEDQSAELAFEANHAEPRIYELGFHIDAELPQEEAKKTYQALKDLVSSNGTLIAEGEIEKIQLAYTISRMDTTGRRDFNSAYFGWLAYEANGEGHEAVLAAVRAQTRVIRFIDLRTTKEGAKHSAEMHEFYRKAAQEESAAAAAVESDDDSADVELDAALKEAGVATA